MNIHKPSSFYLLIIAAFIGSFLAGCGSGNIIKDTVEKLNKHNISRVANCYHFYQKLNDYDGPKDLEEFKAFLTNPEYQSNLEMMGIDQNNIDAIFVSERDNQEIKIRWGVEGSAMGSYEPVAFESVGVEGVRLIGFTNGTFDEVEDQETYDEMLHGNYKAQVGRAESYPRFDKFGNEIK